MPTFDPDRTAALAVDTQYGFCHPDGSLYAPGSEDAIEDDHREYAVDHADLLFGERTNREDIMFE